MMSFNTIPKTGVFNQIFHLTNVRVFVLGWPAQGYYINLIQFIILLVIAVVVIYVTERLTKTKVGGLAMGVILTLLGAFLIQSVTTKVPDFLFEGVRVVSSLIGAIIIGVFYVLIRAQFSKGSK